MTTFSLPQPPTRRCKLGVWLDQLDDDSLDNFTTFISGAQGSQTIARTLAAQGHEIGVHVITRHLRDGVCQCTDPAILRGALRG